MYLQVENRMADDSQWWWQDEHNIEEEREVEKGYLEMTTDEFVCEEDAYDYALEKCLNDDGELKEEFKEVLVEWFYSGNWVKRG